MSFKDPPPPPRVLKAWKEALQFYLSRENHMSGAVAADKGKRAREALTGTCAHCVAGKVNGRLSGKTSFCTECEWGRELAKSSNDSSIESGNAAPTMQQINETN